MTRWSPLGVDEYRAIRNPRRVSPPAGRFLPVWPHDERAIRQTGDGIRPDESGQAELYHLLPSVHAETVGARICFFGVPNRELLNINAFDQPGVGGGKQATYALLGKPVSTAQSCSPPRRKPEIHPLTDALIGRLTKQKTDAYAPVFVAHLYWSLENALSARRTRDTPKRRTG